MSGVQVSKGNKTDTTYRHVSRELSTFNSKIEYGCGFKMYV